MVLSTNSIARETEDRDNGCRVGRDKHGKGYLIRPDKKAPVEEPVEEPVKTTDPEEAVIEEEAKEKPKNKSRKK